MSQQNKNDYILNEYFLLRVRQDLESLYCDFYKNFGWIIESITPDTFDNRYVTIKFKRDRKIKNKVELNELQRKGENALKAIERLEGF